MEHIERAGIHSGDVCHLLGLLRGVDGAARGTGDPAFLQDLVEQLPVLRLVHIFCRGSQDRNPHLHRSARASSLTSAPCTVPVHFPGRAMMSMNHGSIMVRSWIVSYSNPLRRASAIRQIRMSSTMESCSVSSSRSRPVKIYAG